MNILHIIPNLSKGGAERLTLDIVRELNSRKEINVKLVLFRDEIEYNISDLKDLITIIPSRIELSMWKKNQTYVEALQAFIDEFKPDIIHSHLFEAEIVSRSCTYPKSTWFSHGHSNMVQFNRKYLKRNGPKVFLTNAYERNYLQKRYKANGGNNFIAVSKDTERYLKTHIRNFPVFRLENAIDFSSFFHQRSFDNQKLSIINVGSFQKKKNQQLLVLIAQQLAARNIDFSIQFLGEGTEQENVIQLKKETNVTSKIECLGNVSDVQYYLNSATLYVHTASYEPFGLVLLEAMASGLPVITLDGKGNRDIIEQGKNGYMIFEEDPALFAEAIVQLWEDKKTYKAISLYAQEYARQFDIQPYVDKLLMLYNTAISSTNEE